MEMMKVVTLVAPKMLSVSEDEVPKIRNDEVLVKTRRVGICGTDLKVFNGSYSGLHRYPVIPGHEWIGEIVEVGNNVDSLGKGDKVIGSVSIWCGECISCKKGNTENCEEIAHFGLSADGACRGYFTIKPRFLYKIPNNMDLDVGVLIEPLAVAYHGLSIVGNISNSDSIAIFGAGPIGLSCITMAKTAGVGEIISIDFISKRLETARRLGATVQINAEEDPVERILNLTGRNGVDLCIDAAGEVEGMPPALPNGIKATRKSGKLLLIGFYKTPLPLALEDIVNKGLKIYGKIPGAHVVFQDVIRVLSSSRVHVEDIITHHFPLEKASDAYKTALDKEKAIKVVLNVD